MHNHLLVTEKLNNNCGWTGGGSVEAGEEDQGQEESPSGTGHCPAACPARL